MSRKSLPNIEPLPNMPQTANVVSSGSHTSIASSICSLAASTFNTQALTTTATSCSNVITSPAMSAPKMVEVVVVNSVDTDNSVAEKDNINTSAKPEYKLTEIVSQEKGQLFKLPGEESMELEPPRVDVFTVRRRSRQFFTLNEEDEFDGENEKLAEGLTEPDSGDKTIHVQPVFNLGESLRRLYFPNEYRSKNMNRKRVVKGEAEEAKKNAEEIDSPTNFASDPVGCASLYQKISNAYGLRRVQSSPEMEDIHETIPDIAIFDYSTFSKSKSLPTTPKVSPKLPRKNKTTDEIPDKKQVAETSGPGFSFLAKVAGDVRMYKAKQEQLRQEEKRKLEEKIALAMVTGDKTPLSSGQVVERNNNLLTVPAQSDNSESAKSSGSGSNNVYSFRPRACSNESDSDGEGSFVKNIISWGTKKKVRMSGKESNMFSPTSF